MTEQSTAVQPPLFLPGWEQEPCGDEQAFLDLHGLQPRRAARRPTETVAIPIDHYPEGAIQCPDPT